MTLFDVNDDPFDDTPDYVRVDDTHIGKGVFANRPYPPDAVVGEITGELSDDLSFSDEYTFEFTDELQLFPGEPFRYLNHSCNPNCDFDLLDQPQTDEEPARSALFLFTTRTIQPGEPLTIDYNWPANSAIRCQCGEPSCRGWVVSIDELSKVKPVDVGSST